VARAPVLAVDVVHRVKVGSIVELVIKGICRPVTLAVPPRLRSIAVRMLGSAADADDTVQET
jgi:hypothetical protein